MDFFLVLLSAYILTYFILTKINKLQTYKLDIINFLNFIFLSIICFKINAPVLIIIYYLLFFIYYFVFVKFKNLKLSSGLVIFALILIKYTNVLDSINIDNNKISSLIVGLGLSYTSFKAILYFIEYQHSLSIKSYLSYVLFFPGIQVGPITRPDNFLNSLSEKKKIESFQNIKRIIFGLFKFIVLAEIFNQASFQGLGLKPEEYSFADLCIASYSYLLFIFFNFSGFCDIIIASCNLVGISNDENFNSPLFTRNLADFWSNWHISLSSLLRDYVFTPLNMSLLRMSNMKFRVWILCFSYIVSFVLIGAWHGNESKYIAFGALQAFGMCIHSLFTITLKKVLTKAHFKSYNNNKALALIAYIVNTLFLIFSFTFFANSPSQAILIMRSALSL